MLMALGDTSQPVGVVRTLEESRSDQIDRWLRLYTGGIKLWFPPSNFAKLLGPGSELGALIIFNPLVIAGILTPPLAAYLLLRKAGR